MKLLFDNNLSHKLIARLSDIFPNSTHVMTINLDESEDDKIWEYAKENQMIHNTHNLKIKKLMKFSDKFIIDLKRMGSLINKDDLGK